MGATLDALHRLQEAETQLVALHEQVRAKHRAVAGSRKRLQQIDESIAAKQAQIQHNQMEADRAELDRKSREAEIAKLRDMLNRVKTNKEYSAVLTKINTDKADNAKLEDRVLKMLSSLDQEKETLRQLQDSRAKEAERLASLAAAAAQFEASVQDQIAALKARRAEVAENLPVATVQQFERIASKHDGQALARVMQVDRRRTEYVCEGCNMSATLEQISALQSRDDMQLCHSCGRILFLDDVSSAAKR